MHMKQQNIL